MRTYLVLHTLNTAPRAHNERVVRGDYGDYVDALRLELVVLVDEAREVADMACWLNSQSTEQRVQVMCIYAHATYCERARNRKQDDLLALPLVGREFGGYRSHRVDKCPLSGM